MFKKSKLKGMLFTVLLCIVALTGCGQGNNQESKKINIVCTIFPEYDWIKEITAGCDNYEINFLLDNGVDIHNYQPATKDIANISTCDMLVYVGGESEKWIDDALKNAVNKNMKVIKLMDLLGDKVKEEELVEGMESKEQDHDHAHEEEKEYDEHVWLSLKNASYIAGKIAQTLEEIDSSNAEKISGNASEYCRRLEALDEEYSRVVSTAKTKTLIFGDRFPFRYMVDDYDLEYFAAFAGCMAESEASFNTITFLASRLDELKISKICVLEGSDKKLARTVIENTKDKNQEMIILDSMQSVTSKDLQAGKTYLGTMSSNLEALKKALN